MLLAAKAAAISNADGAARDVGGSCFVADFTHHTDERETQVESHQEKGQSGRTAHQCQIQTATHPQSRTTSSHPQGCLFPIFFIFKINFEKKKKYSTFF